MRNYLILLIISGLISCQESPKEDSSFPDVDTMGIIQNIPSTKTSGEYSPTDTLAFLYNSLPEILAGPFKCSLGILKDSEDSPYLLFKKEAELGNPDSTESISINYKNYTLNFSRGYHAYDINFFRDNHTIWYVLIKIIDANVHYGEDHILYLLQIDSTHHWKNITYKGINTIALAGYFLPNDHIDPKTQELFHAKISPDSNTIVLTINHGRKHLCKTLPNSPICLVPESKKNDSIVLKWSLQESRYLIKAPL